MIQECDIAESCVPFGASKSPTANIGVSIRSTESSICACEIAPDASCALTFSAFIKAAPGISWSNPWPRDVECVAAVNHTATVRNMM